MSHLEEDQFENIEPEWHRSTVAQAFNERTFNSIAGRIALRVGSLEELIASIRSAQRLLARASLDIEHLTLAEDMYDDEEGEAAYDGPAHQQERECWDQTVTALGNVDLDGETVVNEEVREFLDSIIEERAGLDHPRPNGAVSFVIAERRVIEEVLARLTE